MKRAINEVPGTVVPIDKIVEPEVNFVDEIKKLAKSMQERGLVYPIIVATQEPDIRDKIYRIKNGRKRFAAARSLKWKEILAIVIPPVATQEIEGRFTDLIEGCLRGMTDYQIAEAAITFENNYEIKVADFAGTLGISQGYTYNLMRWYRRLPQDIHKAWQEGHALINQSELEKMSKMESEKETLAYWNHRLRQQVSPDLFIPEFENGHNHNNGARKKRPRRASKNAMLKLKDAVEESRLAPQVKKLASGIISFALGDSKNVPGITDYKRLPPSITDSK